MPTFRNTVCSIFIGLWGWNRQSVPKSRHIKFRSRGITEKKACNIQNTAKVWNQEYILLHYWINNIRDFIPATYRRYESAGFTAYAHFSVQRFRTCVTSCWQYQRLLMRERYRKRRLNFLPNCMAVTWRGTKYCHTQKKNSVALIRERTIPTERPPPVGEVSANFCG